MFGRSTLFLELRGSSGFTIPRLDVPSPLTAGCALVVVAPVRGRYLVLRHPCRSSVPRSAWRIWPVDPASITLPPTTRFCFYDGCAFQGVHMRAGIYYAIAALLLLATVPMYRYILSRTAPLRHPPSPPPSVAPVSRPVRSVPVVKLWYAYNEPLPAGYRCSAANGIVYRTREERGATVVEPLYRSGSVVRCGGDARSSYRR